MQHRGNRRTRRVSARQAAAERALSLLSAWLHYQGDTPGARALSELRRLHNVVWLTPELAVAEAYQLLERFDALGDFIRWADAYASSGGYWPHRERQFDTGTANQTRKLGQLWDRGVMKTAALAVGHSPPILRVCESAISLRSEARETCRA